MKPATQKFAIVKTRFLKGDVTFDGTVREFDTRAEAEAHLSELLKTVDHGFRWSDWDEYDVRAVETAED